MVRLARARTRDRVLCVIVGLLDAIGYLTMSDHRSLKGLINRLDFARPTVAMDAGWYTELSGDLHCLPSIASGSLALCVEPPTAKARPEKLVVQLSGFGASPLFCAYPPHHVGRQDRGDRNSVFTQSAGE